MDITAPGYIWWKNLKIPPVFPMWGDVPIRMMREAVLAADNSPDPSTRNGALLHLPHLGGATLTACNLPVVPAPGGRLAEDRDYKMAVTEHAEAGAVLTALNCFGSDTPGGTLYGAWACCPDCARIILAGGCRMLIVHGPSMIHTPDDWRRPIELGYTVLQEAGVPIYQTTEPLGLKMFRRGVEIEV